MILKEDDSIAFSFVWHILILSSSRLLSPLLPFSPSSSSSVYKPAWLSLLSDMPFNLRWIFFALCPFLPNLLPPYTDTHFFFIPKSSNCTFYCHPHCYPQSHSPCKCRTWPCTLMLLIKLIIHFLCGLLTQICSSKWERAGTYLPRQTITTLCHNITAAC